MASTHRHGNGWPSHCWASQVIGLTIHRGGCRWRFWKPTVSGWLRIRFRFGGRPFKRSLKTKDRATAEAILLRVEATLADLEVGRLRIPEGADVGRFVVSDGRVSTKVELPQVLTLGKLFEQYEAQLPTGAVEANTLVTLATHKKHLVKLLGGKQAVQTLTATDLQTNYINRRAKETWAGKPIRANTIKKEIATLRALWNWAVNHGKLVGQPPTKGLRYDKGKEQPPFMTWAEIEKRIARGGLTEQQIEELWDCLFLDTDQIRELLACVKEKATQSFIYPMFVFIAHTGARRSEMLRSQIDDFDFSSGQVRLSEKKKDRSVKLTYRHVEISSLLREVMQDWFSRHPGGQSTICDSEGNPFTGKVAWRLFREALAGTKWEVLHGFHAFRHSFASNMAAAGVDQRIIDGFMGHQTDEMRRRYRHLFPKNQRSAIDLVFPVRNGS